MLVLYCVRVSYCAIRLVVGVGLCVGWDGFQHMMGKWRFIPSCIEIYWCRPRCVCKESVGQIDVFFPTNNYLHYDYLDAMVGWVLPFAAVYSVKSCPRDYMLAMAENLQVCSSDFAVFCWIHERDA